MADINQLLSLGIGAPSDIPHFLLLGLSPSQIVASADTIVMVQADDLVIRVAADDYVCVVQSDDEVFKA